jgi:hypothetical protein
MICIKRQTEKDNRTKEIRRKDRGRQKEKDRDGVKREMKEQREKDGYKSCETRKEAR